MSYFYVDENKGTGGTEYATKQTGSFAALGAANIYPSVTAAMTGGASDYDIICCSHLHNLQNTGSLVYAGGTSSPLTITSVDDSNCDAFLVGANEDAIATSNDLTLSGLITFIGFDFTLQNNVTIPGTSRPIRFVSTSVKLNIGGNYFSVTGDGGIMIFDNCNIDLAHDNNRFVLNRDGMLIMDGGSITHSIDTNGLYLTSGDFTLGGGTVKITGTDLSSISGNLIANVGADATNDDVIQVTIDKCKLNAGVAFHNETFSSQNQSILVTQSSSSSAEAEYQYYYHTAGGTVEDEATIHRDESTAFAESNAKVSLKCVTNTDAELSRPFVFDFPTRFASLATASTDTLRIYLASTTALDDADVWAEVTYPDGTNKQTFNKVNSLGTPANIPQDSFRTPAALTSDTGSTWKNGASDLVGYNEYYIDLDTSADVGANCVPKITMFVATPSITIYFDTDVDEVA